jgi:lactoylglutathione lyase
VITGRPTLRSMIPIQNLFEVHLSVADLDRAIVFYRDLLGLRLAHIESRRGAAFFWVGDAGNAMLGLWSTGSGPQTITLHTAFRATLSDVIAAPAILRAAGITPLDFDGRPTEQPIVFAWMPAAIVPWRMWELMHGATPAANHTSLGIPDARNIRARS